MRVKLRPLLSSILLITQIVFQSSPPHAPFPVQHHFKVIGSRVRMLDVPCSTVRLQPRQRRNPVRTGEEPILRVHVREVQPSTLSVLPLTMNRKRQVGLPARCILHPSPVHRHLPSEVLDRVRRHAIIPVILYRGPRPCEPVAPLPAHHHRCPEQAVIPFRDQRGFPSEHIFIRHKRRQHLDHAPDRVRTMEKRHRPLVYPRPVHVVLVNLQPVICPPLLILLHDTPVDHRHAVKPQSPYHRLRESGTNIHRSKTRQGRKRLHEVSRVMSQKGSPSYFFHR